MATTTIKNMRILVRRDIAANWRNSNPTLLVGEQGYETDERGLKFGDGVTPWNELPYFMGLHAIDGGSPTMEFGEGPTDRWPHGDYS